MADEASDQSGGQSFFNMPGDGMCVLPLGFIGRNSMRCLFIDGIIGQKSEEKGFFRKLLTCYFIWEVAFHKRIFLMVRLEKRGSRHDFGQAPLRLPHNVS